MDLKSLKMLDSTVVELLHPETDEPMGISITLAHRDSAVVKAVSHAAANKRLAAMMRKGKKDAPTAEAIEADSLAILVAATLGWSGLEECGEAVPCTPENVERIYTEYPWIRAQVDEAFGDQSRFFRK